MMWAGLINLFYLWKDTVVDSAQYFMTFCDSLVLFRFAFCLMDPGVQASASVCLFPPGTRNLKAAFVTHLLQWPKISITFPNSIIPIANILTYLLFLIVLHVFLKATLFVGGGYKWSKQNSIPHLFL